MGGDSKNASFLNTSTNWLESINSMLKSVINEFIKLEELMDAFFMISWY